MSASNRISPMSGCLPCPAKPAVAGTHLHRVARATSMLIIAGILSACGSLHRQPTPVPAPAPSTATSPAYTMPTLVTLPDGTLAWERGKARWLQAQWDDLPGWHADRTSEVWSALWRSCQRPVTDWLNVCTRARVLGASWGRDAGDETVRRWLQGYVQPWRVETPEGQTSGLLTGYFEPMIEARRQPQGAFQTPLFRPPADLGQRKPYYSRTELETLPEARAAMSGRELVYVADPLDALLVQVQGSTRVRLLDELNAQGQPKVIRLAFAGHNDQPYQSVARWLVDQGAFPLEQASWSAIKGWASLNPQRVSEMLRANPRVVFFKEEALTQVDNGPLGAQGVPLTPGRSIAVDKELMPYGTPVWLESTEPQAWSATPVPPKPLQRLVVAQDTGGAITGAVRADYFWGWGDEALTQAGRTKQPLRMWVLWPK
jgi:membrane-bound lytic murein transglycosylase A